MSKKGPNAATKASSKLAAKGAATLADKVASSLIKSFEKEPNKFVNNTLSIADQLIRIANKHPQQTQKIILAMVNKTPPTPGSFEHEFNKEFKIAFEKKISKTLQKHPKLVTAAYSYIGLEYSMPDEPDAKKTILDVPTDNTLVKDISNDYLNINYLREMPEYRTAAESNIPKHLHNALKSRNNQENRNLVHATIPLFNIIVNLTNAPGDNSALNNFFNNIISSFLTTVDHAQYVHGYGHIHNIYIKQQMNKSCLQSLHENLQALSDNPDKLQLQGKQEANAITSIQDLLKATNLHALMKLPESHDIPMAITLLDISHNAKSLLSFNQVCKYIEKNKYDINEIFQPNGLSALGTIIVNHQYPENFTFADTPNEPFIKQLAKIGAKLQSSDIEYIIRHKDELNTRFKSDNIIAELDTHPQLLSHGAQARIIAQLGIEKAQETINEVSQSAFGQAISNFFGAAPPEKQNDTRQHILTQSTLSKNTSKKTKDPLSNPQLKRPSNK